MGPTAMEEFYYGALRSMKEEYLIRTITKALEDDEANVKQVWVRIPDGCSLGDDKVEIGMYVEEVIEEEPMFEGEPVDGLLEALGGKSVASLQKEPETVWVQLSRDTYVSDICYEVAEILAKGC